jgi:hypothetical protein
MHTVDIVAAPIGVAMWILVIFMIIATYKDLTK